MWRLSITLLMILVFTVSGMLFWQWDAYSNETDLSEEVIPEYVHQMINIDSRGDQLHITQKISGLKSNKEYRVMIPERVSDWKCVKNDGSFCQSGDEDPDTYLADDGSITLKYKIELNKNNSSFLLDNWSVTLPDVTVRKTLLKIIDESKRKGTWISSLERRGFEELEFIDYYVFKGYGAADYLLWHSTPLIEENKQKGITFYVTEKNQASYSFKSIKEIAEFPDVIVVLTNQVKEMAGKGLVVVKPDVKREDLERKLIYHYFLNKFGDLSSEEKWLADVITSLEMNEESRVKKGNELIGQLRTNLSPDEIKRFLDLVEKAKRPLTPNALDEMLSRIKGKNTRFFSLNKDQTTRLVPFYYIDTRKIKIQDKVQEDIHAIMVGGDKLYPFVETMRLLGFEVETLYNQRTLLLQKDHNSYRFFLNQSIFIYNEENYGLLEKPLTEINGKVYIKDRWLQTIFKVIIQEGDKEITLSLL